MAIEFKRYSFSSKASHHTHMVVAKLKGFGWGRGDYRLPDLLLTMSYSLDAKGDVKEFPEPHFVFQPDGPCDTQLNFPHTSLKLDFVHSVCRFRCKMDAVFGEGVVVKKSASIGGTLGAEKGVKGEVQAGAEMGQESPGTRTYVHALIEGILSAKEQKLEVWGQVM